MIFSAGLTFFLASLLAHLPPTSSNPLGIPITPTNISLTASNLQCIDSPDWTTPSFLGGDCYTALDKLQNRKVLRYNSMLLEFYAANITPSYPSRFSQATPQKYKYKTCTLAIVMLKDLPGGAVPGTTLRETDLGTYVNIENAAKRILKVCLSVVMEKGRRGGGGLGFVNPTGYDTAGIRESIGVFIWDTDSVINHQIQVAETASFDLEGPTTKQHQNGSALREIG